jgi:hypothetical protein
MKKFPAVLAVIYLIVVAVSIVPIFTESDALSGVLAIFVTSPWSLMLGTVVPEGMFWGFVMVAIGAFINAAIIYAISKLLVRLISK